MTIPMKRLTEILVEVTNGTRPEKPDTPEEAEKRAKYQADVNRIAAQGGIVDIPDMG